jgi:hypothetical protein
VGVVYADVVARVQERAARAAADELKRQFAEVGDSVGRETSDRIDTSLRGTLPRVAQQAGAEFMGGFGDAIRSGIPGISGSLGGLSTVLKGIGTDGAAAGLAASAGIAAITVAAVKAGEALYGVGARFDAVFDNLAVRTGKAGQDLDALSQSIRNVYTSTAGSLEEIGDIGARLSQSLNLSGSPLEDLSQQVANLNRMTGENLNIRRFGQLLRGFGEDSQQAGSDLDALMAASQRTGIPINELVSTLTNLGPVARSMGMDINASAAMIAAFEKAGIDADKTTAGLNRAVAQFADNGINLQTGLRDTITQIRGFIDAGNEAAAIDLANKVFGERSAQRFVDAIRQGTLNVETLRGGLENTDGTIARLNEQTQDWSEQWDILSNKVDNLAGKLGGPLFDAVNNVLGAMNKMLEGDFSGAIVGGPWSGGGSPGMTFPGGLGGGPNASRERRGLPVGPGAPPQDIAAALAEDAKAAAGLPDAPVLPLPAGYGMGPNPGETQEQWSARMSDLSAQHDLAEKRARLNQLEQTTTATANDIISAKNAVVEAEMRQLQTTQRYLQSLQQQAAATPDVAFPDGYMQGPRPGQTAGQYAAEGNVYEAQQKRAQAEAVYLQLQQSGVATTAELAEAHNNLIAATRAENEASLRLSDAYKDSSEKSRLAAEGLTDVGMKLDADFGVSKGLPGIAENIVKFLGNLALAPVFGALQGVQAANGGYDPSMGSGLAGVAGLAAGMPFGRRTADNARTPGIAPTIAPYNPDLSGLPSSIASAGTGGPAATGSRAGAIPSGALAGLPLPLPVTIVGGSAGAVSGVAGAMPGGAMSGSSGTWAGDAALLSRVPGGQYAQIQAADLTKGLGDCTSAVEDLVNMMDGRPTAGREMSTGNAASWLASRGFMPNTTGANIPGAMNVGFRHDYGTGQAHMEATLPGGTNFNWGDAASAASGGTLGAVGAFGDPSFTQHFFRPVGGAGGGAMSSAGRPSTTMTTGSPSRLPATGSLPPMTGGGAGGYAPMTQAELTNPGLSTPRLLGGGTGAGAALPGLAGAPQSPFAMGGAADPSQSVIGGRAYGQGTPASGGLGFGGSGLIGLAASAAQTGIAAAGLAADAAGGGGGGSAGAAIAGAFAQIGIQELQRAVGAGAQYAGALAGGVLETFSLNDSALGDPSKSWLGKLAGVVAGVRPSLPNSAGKEGGAANPNMAEAGKKAEAEKGPPGPLTPQQAEAQKAADAQNAGGQGGNGTTINNNVTVTNQRATEDYTGQVVQAHLGTQAMAGQAR